uniref:Uncharacterized protein n=1 Tax=Peronospora matthiolae TaxID=2874970 RepID=A0AAV1T8N5_9STRA
MCLSAKAGGNEARTVQRTHRQISLAVAKAERKITVDELLPWDKRRREHRNETQLSGRASRVPDAVVNIIH